MKIIFLKLTENFLKLFKNDNKLLLIVKNILNGNSNTIEFQKYVLDLNKYKEIISKMHDFIEINIDNIGGSYNLSFLIFVVLGYKLIIDENINLNIENDYLKIFAEKLLLTENNINTLFDNLDKVENKENLTKYDILFNISINRDFLKINIDKIKKIRVNVK